MAYEKIVITITLGIVLTAFFYYNEINNTPEIIELESRLNSLLLKINKIMSDPTVTQLLNQTILQLNSRDEKFDSKLDKVIETQSKQGVQIEQMRGEIRLVQTDVKYMKGKKEKPPPKNDDKTRAVISENSINLNINLKAFKKASVWGSGSAITIYGIWEAIQNFFLN